MVAKHVQPRLGSRQKLALGVLFDHGVWEPGMPYGIGTDTATGLVMDSLHGRGMARLHRDRYCLSPEGYAWLLRDSAGDLGMVGFGNKAIERVANRISQLAQCARLVGVHGGNPVDWRGNPV